MAIYIKGTKITKNIYWIDNNRSEYRIKKVYKGDMLLWRKKSEQ